MLTIYKYCNNDLEFKAFVTELAKKLGIQIICDHVYHSQTQDTVKIMNRIFKW